MPTPELDVVRGLHCRAVTIPLGAGAAPTLLVPAVEQRVHGIALVGEWCGGGALLTSDPVHVVADPDGALAAVGAHPTVVDADDAVVGGGWFGWFGFDAPPFLAFYDHVVRHRDGQWWFEALWSDERAGELTERLAWWRARLDSPGDRPRWSAGDFGGASPEQHLAAVEQAVEWIRAGEIYQVNVCTRLDAEFTGSAGALFAQAVDRLAPRFGAYVDGVDRTVLCLSPELFLRRRGRDVSTSPIKGTAPRTGSTGAGDLQTSVKDAAENVMIVDLMRNDLGRVCETGSVRTAALLDIEAHPGVWHLVSTVTGRLRDDVDDGRLLAATLPPGSVTGAPKLHSLDAIRAIEHRPRGVYTGAVGFAAPTWGAEFAVAIRTFECSGGRIELGVGGGVTADSVPMREWQECLDKATPLLVALDARVDASLDAVPVRPTTAQLGGGVLETVLVRHGVPVALADHLARLDRSCRELYRFGIPDDLVARCVAAAARVRDPRAVLRVVVAPSGQVDVTCGAIGPAAGVGELRVVRRAGGLWRHKWADRSGFRADEADERRAPLYVGDDGAVLETSRGNVFLICPDGSLRTPPLRDDLLPGVTRRRVLDIARDSGRATSVEAFTVAELEGHAAFWTSSLSGVVGIVSVDGRSLPRRDADVAEIAAAVDRSR